jgi:cell division protein FtsL
MRRLPQQYPNPHVRRQRDPRAARRQAILLVGCLVLACGFIYAVRQQILAVDYGYKTETLRREREELLDEQRRLLLAVEESSSPARLEEAGRELGMQPARAAQIEAASNARGSEGKGTGIAVGTASAGAVLRR